MKTESAITPGTILFNREPMVAISAIVSNSGLVADSDGKKILKAGTPVYGLLSNRALAFVKATQLAAIAKASFVFAATHACSANGNVSVQLGFRAAVSIAVTTAGQDTIAKVATAIAGGTYPGWSAAVDEDDDTKVIFTATDPGEQPAPVFGYAATGVTGTAGAVTQPRAASSNAVGIMLHEVDVTEGNKNTQILIFGFANLGKIENGVVAAADIAALAGKVAFIV